MQPAEYYNKIPLELAVSVCLVIGPMLATGGSAGATDDLLKKWGVFRIKFLGIKASPEGVMVLHQTHPDVPLHLAIIDEGLNQEVLIVPGLGDAGDRLFGTG